MTTCWHDSYRSRGRLSDPLPSHVFYTKLDPSSKAIVSAPKRTDRSTMYSNLTSRLYIANKDLNIGCAKTNSVLPLNAAKAGRYRVIRPVRTDIVHYAISAIIANPSLSSSSCAFFRQVKRSSFAKLVVMIHISCFWT